MATLRRARPWSRPPGWPCANRDRKLACIAWQLLSKEEDYVFAQPSLVRAKLRRAELNAGAPPLRRGYGGRRISATPAERENERELVARGETAYRRLIADWKATGPGKKGAGATPGRESSGPSTDFYGRSATGL